MMIKKDNYWLSRRPRFTADEAWNIAMNFCTVGHCTEL